jgi:hypothetical protein
MDYRKMNKGDRDRYDRRCSIIEKLVIAEFKDQEFDFVRNKDTWNIEIAFRHNGFTLATLLLDNTFQEIKRHLNKKLSGAYHNNICDICFEISKISASCNKCANSTCGECYINIFKTNKGIMTCPQCRHTFGYETPEYLMEYRILEIRENFLGR